MILDSGLLIWGHPVYRPTVFTIILIKL